MPSNKKIQITDAGENNLLPHTSLDNLQVSKTDNTSVTLATEIGATGSTAAIPTEHAVRQALDEKQDNFAAGENVSTEASNGVSLEVSSAGVLGVHADKTSASGFGTVKIGTNVTVDDGVISIPDASTAAKGVVKIDTAASNGVALTIDGGTVKVNAEKASVDGFGTIKVDTAASNGVSLEINGGTVKVNAAKASADAFGTVKVDTAASNGVSLEIDGGTVKVNAAKVTNESSGVLGGVGDGIALDNGVISADVGSGLKIGASTTSDAGKVVIDDASVETTLQDVRIDGASTVSPVNDQVITPGNLRGALSVVTDTCFALFARL